jgi:hypothetical protein
VLAFAFAVAAANAKSGSSAGEVGHGARNTTKPSDVALPKLHQTGVIGGSSTGSGKSLKQK